jgi:SagB-type dehydrogenase family enzyme
VIRRYHDGTKHHFHQFARSLGYLDWASQPAPFRSFDGAPAVSLWPRETAAGYVPARLTYDQLFAAPAAAPAVPRAAALGDVLRHALGLSAWKRLRDARWALRVNPSSGNLHPTEAYVICGPLADTADTAAVHHYAPDRHVLERRCLFASDAWQESVADAPIVALVALTSIHWREAWKYGERAFRYCQHDLGHAVAALRVSAALAGWTMTILPEWSHADIAALTGTDRARDYEEAEPEEPGCLLAVLDGRLASVDARQPPALGKPALLNAVRNGRWSGRASQLSEDHVAWTFIDEIASATRDPGRSRPASPAPPADAVSPADRSLDGRAMILQRRSAVAFDGRSSIGCPAFLRMLDRTMPSAAAPWDALWWDARIHLALFVHRVDTMPPGLYLLVREPRALDRLKAAFGRDFAWTRSDDRLPLYLLAPGDARATAQRLSCDQDIASDGFFSLGMIADFDRSLADYGPSFYRHLFWESGVVGQMLYLEAEAAGVRATGIGCFYDDAVHDVLGITGHEFQSLYHFTVGAPVDDHRLTTEPGYSWE